MSNLNPATGSYPIKLGKYGTAPVTTSTSEAAVSFATDYNTAAAATINVSSLTATCELHVYNLDATDMVLVEFNDSGDFLPVAPKLGVNFGLVNTGVTVRVKSSANTPACVLVAKWG